MSERDTRRQGAPHFRPHLSTEPDGFLETERREPLADARIRPLLERYVAAAGARLEQVDDGILELHVPEQDRSAFRKRARVRIAFTVDALERDPEAEIAVVGSAFVEQLIAAIRSRGSRVSHGFVAPEHEPAADEVELRIPLTNGSAAAPRVAVARHRVVRLLAKVVVRAGGAVEEHLIESAHFDATTGMIVPAVAAARCIAATSSLEPREENVTAIDDDTMAAPTTRTTAELVSLALADLRASFEPKVGRLRADAQRALQLELQRIDRYYDSLLDGLGGRASDVPDVATRRAYEAEHARRRAEEERRHQVHVIVHPVQLTEWQLLVQRAEWEITPVRQDRTGGTLVAARWLNGSGTWEVACPSCGHATPRALSLCKAGHLACDACATTCGVCSEAFCHDHGIGACRVDGRPACAEHARTCPSCRERYCTGHESLCAEGGHPACTECSVPCAICGRSVCDAHAQMTHASAPRGARRLCGDCRVLCEGGTSEPVGRDEVERCSDCQGYVCETHRAGCAVDHRIHCSKHMRRSDESRRLVCTAHQAECSFEPGAIFASDEVWPCATCGRRGCGRHSHVCVEDGGRYCDEHALLLRGEDNVYACKAHVARCHVDMGAHRIGTTAPCPVCDRTTCKQHLRSCSSCGRQVCVRDFVAHGDHCTTCERLTTTGDPSDHVIAAAAALLGERPTPRRWKTSRDATHTIVEMDLGWTRRVVFLLRHGDTAASGGRSHSILGSSPLRLHR